MTRRRRFAGALLALVVGIAAEAHAQNCDGTSTGRVPITDLGSALYLDQFPGGLYPDGNELPSDHRTEGLAQAGLVVPRDAAGAPDPSGKIVLISIGMSNTDQEWCFFNGFACAPFSFTGQALADPAVDHEHLVIANGAAGAQTAPTWTEPDAENYGRIAAEVLPPLGVTPAQVQVAWVKLANGGPTVHLPDPDADAFELEGQLGEVVRSLRINYPNLALVFFSSRVYGGYATTTLNPEPYAYETGFAVKWLIEAQIDQLRGADPDARAGDLDVASGVAPWLGWGAYLWADGTTPRSDGLTWSCSDFVEDGTHPSNSGKEKVGQLLLASFLGSEIAAPWFRAAPEASAFATAAASLATLGLLARRRRR